MDMEALRIVSTDRYIPIYLFDKQKYEDGLDPLWVTSWSEVGEIPLKVYSLERTVKKHFTLQVKAIVRISKEDTEVSRRNRMKERVLVRA